MAWTDNLVAHWRLNEASGQRNDAHGTRHLTDNNTVGSADGKLGDAASFVQLNAEYLSTTDQGFLMGAGQDWTLAGWLNFNATANRRTVFNKWDSSANREMYFRVSGSTRLEVGLYNTANSFGSFIHSVTLNTGVWHFFILWYDSASDTYYISVNGAAAESWTGKGPVRDNNAVLTIGAVNGGTDPYDGLIDSLSYWTRQLTAQERTDLYNGGAGLDYPFSSEQTIAPSGIASAEAFGTASIATGEVTISPTGIASAEAFGTATVEPEPATIQPSGIGSAEAFGTATLATGEATIQPSGIPSAEAFGTASVSTGEATIQPSGIPSAEAFGTASIISGEATIQPSGIPSGEAFGTASVATGEATITPSGIPSAEVFGTASIEVGTATIYPTGIPSAEAFGVPVFALPSTGSFIAPKGVPGTVTQGAILLPSTRQKFSLSALPKGETFTETALPKTQGAFTSQTL